MFNHPAGRLDVSRGDSTVSVRHLAQRRPERQRGPTNTPTAEGICWPFYPENPSLCAFPRSLWAESSVRQGSCGGAAC